MAMRDNTKLGVKMTSGASKGRKASVSKSMARPGSRNNKKPAGAAAVGTANGNTPRPGYKQKTVKSGGSGTIARPGFAQHISG